MTHSFDLKDVRDFLENLQVEVGYSRVTMLPLIQINWAALLEILDDDESKSTLPFFLSQDKAWASMGTYFFEFLSADPYEMNFPAINFAIRHRTEKTISYVQIITNPFLAYNQRIFYLYGRTGVDYYDENEVGIFRWGVYAHGSMIGAEDVFLLQKFFKSHYHGSPSYDVLNYGLGYALAGSGFHVLWGLGSPKSLLFTVRPYFELNAYLPFHPSAELGIDFGLEISSLPDLVFYTHVKMMKTLWQASGVDMGFRYGFRSLAEVLKAVESGESQNPQASQNSQAVRPSENSIQQPPENPAGDLDNSNLPTNGGKKRKH